MKITLTFKPQHYRALSIIRAQKNPAAFVAKCVLQCTEEKSENLKNSAHPEVQNPQPYVDLKDYVKVSDLEQYVRKLFDQYLAEQTRMKPLAVERDPYTEVMNQQASFFEGAASLFDDD